MRLIFFDLWALRVVYVNVEKGCGRVGEGLGKGWRGGQGGVGEGGAFYASKNPI